MRRLSLVAAAIALMTTVSATAAASAASADQVPATCVAYFYSGSDTLHVAVVLPDFPAYWDIGDDEASARAYATGYATLTPNGDITVDCSDNAAISDDGSHTWPSGRFRESIPDAWTARGGDEFGNGAVVYTGRGTVSTDDTGQVVIRAHLGYDLAHGAM